MKKCIALYDDEPEIVLLCKMILAKTPHRVETFSTCQNVISDVLAVKADLIIMDLRIPDIGGEKAVEMLKENPDTRHIPVLLFSANVEIEEICKKVSAKGFIKKPFDIHDFTKAIELNIYGKN